MKVSSEQIAALCEAHGEDAPSQEITEGIKDILQSWKLRNYQAKMMQKGSHMVYFVYVRSSSSYGKAEFKSGKLEDTYRYNTPDEMEAEIEMLKADGYKTVEEVGIKRFAKFVVRNLGRLNKFFGATNFIVATILVLMAAATGGAALGGAAALIGLQTFAAATVSYSMGWVMVKVAEKKTKLQQDMGDVSDDAIRQSIQEGDEQMTQDAIRNMVRDAIQKKAQELTQPQKPEPKKGDEDA